MKYQEISVRKLCIKEIMFFLRKPCQNYEEHISRTVRFYIKMWTILRWNDDTSVLRDFWCAKTISSLKLAKANDPIILNNNTNKMVQGF